MSLSKEAKKNKSELNEWRSKNAKRRDDLKAEQKLIVKQLDALFKKQRTLMKVQRQCKEKGEEMPPRALVQLTQTREEIKNLKSTHATNTKKLCVLERMTSYPTVYYYIEGCETIVSECTEQMDVRPAYVRGDNEHIFRTVPHHQTVKVDDTIITRSYTCVKEDFLDIIWRIARRRNHTRDFEWKLLKQIRYDKGRLYFLVDMPGSKYPPVQRKGSAEFNTCTNLDIDWDWIESTHRMPEGVVLFDRETDCDLRIRLTKEWLDKTPEELKYREFLMEDAERLRKLHEIKRRRKAHIY